MVKSRPDNETVEKKNIGDDTTTNPIADRHDIKKSRHSRKTSLSKKTQITPTPDDPGFATMSNVAKVSRKEKKSSKSKKRHAKDAIVETKSKHSKMKETPPVLETASVSFESLLPPKQVTGIGTAPIVFDNLLLNHELKNWKYFPNTLESRALKQVEQNELFYEDSVSATMDSDIRYMASYIRSVDECRTESEQCEPFNKASKLPTWNFKDDEALRKLHGIQSVNIWLIDYFIATKTEICKKKDSQKCLQSMSVSNQCVSFE